MTEDDIKKFLEALYGKKPPDLYVLLWNRLNKISAWFRDIAKAAEYTRLNAVNIYSGVGLSPTDFGPRQRCKADEIAGIVAFFADIDYLGEAHKSKVLPRDQAHALKLIPANFPPSMIVESGHGLQAWWILEVPWIFQNHAERTEAKEMAIRWDRYLKLRATRLGFSLDSVFDLSRIMRIPGTSNEKDGCPPAPAYILSLTETRYKLAEFTALMDAVMPKVLAQGTETLALPAPQTEEITLHKPGVMPRTVDPIIYRQNARINPGIFAALWSNDPGFRMTWGGNRPEFADKSQSAFDLALANIFYNAGVPDQDAADALVHHRRLRNQPGKAQPAKYLTSTLTKARERNGGPQPAYKELAASIAAMLSGELPADDDGLPSPDAIEKLATRAYEEEPAISIPDLLEMDRTTAVGKFSTGLGMTVNGTPVSVTRVLRIPDGKSCSWQFNFNHGRNLYLADEGEWSNYDRFAAAIRTQLNGICLIPANRSIWTRTMVPLIQVAMQEVTQADTDYASSTRDIIDGYLVTRGVITKEQAFGMIRNNGLPFLYQRKIDPAPRIAIQAQDVANWIFRYRGEKQSSKEICSGLTAIGAEACPVKRGKRTTQSRWLLPADWDAETYNIMRERDRSNTDVAPEKEEEEEDGWQN